MDARPQIERALHKALLACVALIAGCAVLGGLIAGEAAYRFTRPRVPKGTPA